jgi:hypothetical protein
MLKTRFSRRASAAAKAGAAVMLALGLLASSPYTNEARAIDISGTPNAVNASLVFSPVVLSTIEDNGTLCLRNYSTDTVSGVIRFETTGGTPLATEEQPFKIGPNSYSCTNATSVTGIQDTVYFTQIIFQSPQQCSQATEYPGNCRVVAAMDIFHNASPPTNRLHLEPVLLKGLPGSPRINPVPLPQ